MQNILHTNLSEMKLPLGCSPGVSGASQWVPGRALGVSGALRRASADLLRVFRGRGWPPLGPGVGLCRFPRFGELDLVFCISIMQFRNRSL